MVSFRYKVGSDILMNCDNHNHKDITWEFKFCPTNYKGVHCDKKSMNKLDRSGSKWKKLDFKTTSNLKLKNASEENAGLYRCLYNDSVIKIYKIDVFVATKFTGPTPEVLSLIPSTNSTILPNTPISIQCKVKSVTPPEIRWFKECNGHKCEVKENGHCYCPISSPNSAYSISNNIYLSKHSIQSSRNINSGTYICLVISVYGKDYKNVTIKVQDLQNDGMKNKSFSSLFLIPLCFVLVPVTIWLCFYRRKKKNRNLNEHQKKLIKPVVNVDIVLEENEV
ncbi:fibroblast growth factor receptor-like 1, partial [Asbolus verrucosus]